MTGAEHYAKAESRLDEAKQAIEEGLTLMLKAATDSASLAELAAAGQVFDAATAALLAEAQVHATLALAGATNELHPDGVWQVAR